MPRTRPVRPARLPALPSPAEPGLEQQQGEEKEEELGCPTESRTHRVSLMGALCGAQPHRDKAAVTQALPGSLPSFPGEPWGLWGSVSVPSEGQGWRSAKKSRGDVKCRLAGIWSRKFHNRLVCAVMSNKGRVSRAGPAGAPFSPPLPATLHAMWVPHPGPATKLPLKTSKQDTIRALCHWPDTGKGPGRMEWEQGGVC